MLSKMSRRIFLGTSLATSSVALGEVSWVAWLASEAAEDRIFNVLKLHLGITDEQRSVVKDFIDRLRTPGLHTETPETFAAMAKSTEPELERYVVEEFLVGTNYLALLSGEDQHLHVLVG